MHVDIFVVVQVSCPVIGFGMLPNTNYYLLPTSRHYISKAMKLNLPYMPKLATLLPFAKISVSVQIGNLIIEVYMFNVIVFVHFKQRQISSCCLNSE